MEKEQQEINNTEEQEMKAEMNETEGKVEEQTENANDTSVADELAEMKDKYLRLYSDFDNFRRRTAKERLELIKTASEDLILALLPIIDDFERANKAMQTETDIESVKAGIDLIHAKMVKVLEAKGLKAQDTAQGADFDTELHEAITQIPVENEALKGKVVDTVEKGYTLNEKVIRFAKVVIGAQ